MQLRYLVSNRINVKIPTVRTTDCYVLRTLIKIGLGCLFSQRQRVAHSARIFSHVQAILSMKVLFVVCCFYLCCICELHPIIFSVFNFSISKLCFPYMYVRMYVCMTVCMSVSMYLVWWSRLQIPCSPNRHTNLNYTASNFSVLLDFNARSALQYCNLAFPVQIFLSFFFFQNFSSVFYLFFFLLD